jgi:hypothetical protein
MRFVLAFLLLALGANGASAQNEVYDPEPPRGSAYLRFVNGLGAPVEIRPDFGPSLRLGIGGGERVAAYRTVERVQGAPWPSRCVRAPAPCVPRCRRRRMASSR